MLQLLHYIMGKLSEVQKEFQILNHIQINITGKP